MLASSYVRQGVPHTVDGADVVFYHLRGKLLVHIPYSPMSCWLDWAQVRVDAPHVVYYAHRHRKWHKQPPTKWPSFLSRGLTLT